eukprot:2859458-Prymnesium_polylepis.2
MLLSGPQPQRSVCEATHPMGSAFEVVSWTRAYRTWSWYVEPVSIWSQSPRAPCLLMSAGALSFPLATLEVLKRNQKVSQSRLQ